MMDDDDDRPGEDRSGKDRPVDPAVGYGRPPKASQFKPGQSGNPNGRPRGAKTRRFAGGGYSLRDALVAETERTIVVRERGQGVEMTQLQAVLRRLSILAMQGVPECMALLLKYAALIQRDDQRLNERFLDQILKYKTSAEAEVRRRQAKGDTDTSDILPHPDHIDVDFVTGEVLISGPMSPSEQAAIDAAHEQLQSLRQTLAEWDKLAIEKMPPAMRKQIAEARRVTEAQIREYSEALGQPYP